MIASLPIRIRELARESQPAALRGPFGSVVMGTDEFRVYEITLILPESDADGFGGSPSGGGVATLAYDQQCDVPPDDAGYGDSWDCSYGIKARLFAHWSTQEVDGRTYVRAHAYSGSWSRADPTLSVTGANLKAGCNGAGLTPSDTCFFAHEQMTIGSPSLGIYPSYGPSYVHVPSWEDKWVAVWEAGYPAPQYQCGQTDATISQTGSSTWTLWFNLCMGKQ